MFIPLYLIFHIFVVIYPLLKIKIKEINYLHKIKFLISGFLVSSIPHLIWDIFATKNGDWSFNAKYILGISILGLPIEEILFFFTVPFSCMFVWESVLFLVKEKKIKVNVDIFFLIGTISFIVSFFTFNLPYTRTAFFVFALLNFYIYIKTPILIFKNTFYLALALFLVLFLISNTFLTAIPIVLYSSEAILNIRIGSIPIEDFLFNFTFLVPFLFAYENAKKKTNIVIKEEKKENNKFMDSNIKQVESVSHENDLKSRNKIAILGGGLGGIVAAILLRKNGFEVDLFEKNSYLGGKISEISVNGFRFDIGPSLLTHPEQLEYIFNLCGKDINNYLIIKKLEVLSKNFFYDGKVVNVYSNTNKLAKELYEKLGIKPEDTFAYLKYVKYLSKNIFEIYLFSLLKMPLKLLRLKYILVFLKFPFLGVFQSLNKSLNKFFNNDIYISRIFGRFATYVGSDPFRTPALFNVIANTEINNGGYYIQGGMYSIVKALTKLAEELGVNILLDSSIEFIELDRDQKIIKKIHIHKNNKTVIEDNYKIVISNLDFEYTYRFLLNKNSDIKRYQNLEKSSAPFVLLLGIKSITEILDVHNIFFSDDYKKEFDEIFKLKILPEDPTVYINITSKYSTDDAPRNCENWFVLTNIPSFEEFSDQQIAAYADRIIDKIEKFVPDIKNRIIFRKVLDSNYYNKYCGTFEGALYGLSSNSFINIFSRPWVKDRKIKNLYFVGGTVSPGGGIPIVIQSAINCVNLILKYQKI